MKRFGMLSLLVASTIYFSACEEEDPEASGTVDIEATSITFSVVKDTEFKGQATITATITNVGTGDFKSSVGQQSVYLYQRNLGAAAPGTLVGHVDFTELSAGGQLQVKYTRPWDSASPSEGEFPPDYILTISLDPDILTDGNDRNDDANSANNTKTESGSGINDLF